MHDIKFIRENPKMFDAFMKRRGLKPISNEILELDKERRDILTKLQIKQSERNRISKEIGASVKNNSENKILFQKVLKIKESLVVLEKEESELYQKIDKILMELPNILDKSVPDGSDEKQNKLIRKFGNFKSFSFIPKDHVELGENLNLMDFNTASKISGARFVILRGKLAKLERAIANFMLDIHTKEFNYIETVPPFLVWGNALEGTGQLPKFESDLFQTIDNRWLIPTAEVPLTNFVREKILDYRDLPLRFTAYTPCFRSEAGASGKDTRGMLDNINFQKLN